MESSTPTRRTPRTKKPSLKALESLYSLKIQNSGIVQAIVTSDDESEDEIDLDNIDVDVNKPKVMHENEVVHGEDIFTFQKRKNSEAIAQKVAEACDLKTPKHVRTKTKSRIAKMIQEDSESEFEVSSEESESSSSSNESEDSSGSDSDEKSTKDTKNKKMIFREANLQTTKTRSRNYHIKTDEYFEKTSSKKIETSNNTLERLETPRLPQYKLQKLLHTVSHSSQHIEAIHKLKKVNESCFAKWWFFLNENFNILLYGLGSKRSIISKFQSLYLNNHPVVVVNGYFPSISIKSILDTILDLLEIEDIPGNPIEACDLIISEFQNMRGSSLYIIIHNIEGETLRNGKTQNILAKLASSKNIHFIASIDHINAPLIWDQNKLSKFNYIWWDVTSFLRYEEETSFEQSMMVQQSSTLALSSLRNVFASLTSNSKSIYNLIVTHQIDNGKSQYYQGLAFKDLYHMCREAFIVSSDLALRAQLTEFVDHKMLKMKRSVDGTEYLVIPLASTLLQKFLDENQ
uniref:Origin recognition complex subunit 2 n=1 Tax=Diabrotica virgifera virgifera TaxID=50390 RepID=A0A6P7F1C9_DIAVI